MVSVPKLGIFRYIEDQTTEPMKNERSIEELLADMLRKQDRHEALLGALVEGQSRIVDVQSKMLDAQERMMETQSRMMETQVKMAESIVQTNERLDSLNNRFERLIEVLSNNWFQRIIALEDEVEEIKRKVG